MSARHIGAPMGGCAMSPRKAQVLMPPPDLSQSMPTKAASGTMPSPKAPPAEAPLSNGMPVATGMPAPVPTDQRNGMAAKPADLYGAPAAAPATNGNGMPAPSMAGVLEAAPDLHVLVQPDQEIPADAPRIASDGGPYTLRGTTAHFAVYYENGLGAQGPVLADAVLATCEADYTALQNWFGGLTPSGLPFSVYVVAGTFGAYHANCLATEMHCAAFDGSNADLVRMLMVAEADEVFMAAQNKGFNCGWSNGEGLSRVLATERYPAQLDGFASAASWLDSARADYVGTNEQTDRNYVSIGCSTLFLNYLRYQ